MWPLRLFMVCVFLFAVLAAYLPTVYIRQTNKAIKLLEKIEANTRK